MGVAGAVAGSGPPGGGDAPSFRSRAVAAGAAVGIPRMRRRCLQWGEARRTPPLEDSPHSSLLTWWGGAGTAAAKLRPTQPLPSALVRTHLLLGALWTLSPGSSKALALLGGLQARLSPGSLLDCRPGVTAESATSCPEPASHPSPSYSCGTQSPCPLQRAPSPSWCPLGPPPPGP